MEIIGIDPGLKGGIAILSELRYKKSPDIRVWDMPVADGEIDVKGVSVIFSLAGPKKRAIIEQASPHRGQGLTSTFTFGRGYGKLLACLELAEIYYEIVPPAKWKKAMGLSKHKNDSLEAVKTIYEADVSLWRGPNGGLRDGRCEAALLAWWGRERD